MPSPAYVLREATVYIEETVHLLNQIDDEYDPWTPLEELIQSLAVLRWVLEREIEETSRAEPAPLRPA